jgi:hypothetical protein
VAEVEEVGFMAALSAAQQHVGFWDCYHGFGVFRASPPPTNKTWVATAGSFILMAALHCAVPPLDRSAGKTSGHEIEPCSWDTHTR